VGALPCDDADSRMTAK